MYRSIAVICALVASLSTALAAEMTHEEQTVRATYAKLAYASRTGVLLRYALDARIGNDRVLNNPFELKSEMDRQLAFQFQSVNVGDLTDIADTHWDALVSKPQLDLLSVAFVYHKEPMKIGKAEPFSTMSFVIATWQRWDEHDWDWSTSVKEAIHNLPKDTGKPEVVYSRMRPTPSP